MYASPAMLCNQAPAELTATEPSRKLTCTQLIHSHPAIERQADPALHLLGNYAKLACGLAEIGSEGAERRSFPDEPAEPGLVYEPGEEQGAERARRRRTETAPQPRMRPSQVLGPSPS